jgi:Rieske 2Fe-2S family protein
MAKRSAAPIESALLEPVLRPLAAARTLPGVAYASAAVFEWERRHFFEGSWCCVGRSAEVAAAGDQRALSVGSVGILLIRDVAGTLRGFFNACRHRGHELLAPGTARTARAIKCPYHSWVYGLAGDCRATPRFGAGTAGAGAGSAAGGLAGGGGAGAEDAGGAGGDGAGAGPGGGLAGAGGGLDREELGLVPVRLAEWHGWVFVNVSGDAPPIQEHIGNADLVVADYQPERLRLGATSAYEVAANWKIVVENYLECYHCSSIHPELCRVTPPDSGFGYPQEPAGLWLGGPLRLREHAVTMSLSGESLGVPIPSVPASRRAEVGYAALLPNLLISPHPDYLMTHRLVPLAAGRTLVECAWYFPPEAFDRPGFSPDYAARFWDLTNREDWQACESVQRNAASPGYRPGPISPWESDVWREMCIVAQGYRSGRLAPFGSGPAGSQAAASPAATSQSSAPTGAR